MQRRTKALTDTTEDTIECLATTDKLGDFGWRQEGPMPRRYVAKPATWGAATEVPSMVWSFHLSKVEVTFTPAAQMISMGAPRLGKSASVSSKVEVATVITSLTRAGE